MIDEKIKEIAQKKGFTSFWETVDYMLHGGYSELDALKVGLELYNGDIWGGVINTRIESSLNSMVFGSNGFSTITTTYRNGGYIDVATERNAPDDLQIEIHVITKHGNPLYMDIYKAYLETSKYEPVEELNSHIKTLTIVFRTELGIKFFREIHHNKFTKPKIQYD